MNIQVLNELMRKNAIPSYYQLAKDAHIPYTTLLDLVRGKGDKLSNIKILADFFSVKMTYLIEDNGQIVTINEKNKIKTEKITGYNSILSNLLSN